MAPHRVTANVKLDGFGELPVFDFTMEEKLFEIPTYTIDIGSEQVALSKFLGQDAEIKPVALSSDTGTPRSFAGIVTGASSEVAGGVPFVRLTVQPAIAVLGLSSNSAIYLNKTSIDITKDVLERNGLKRLKVTASSLSTKRDICVQYNENDLDFVKRILAEDGFTFYVHDGADATTLMLHDVQKPFAASKDKEASGTLKLTDAATPDASRVRADQVHVTEFLTAAKVSLTHYDPDTAKVTTKGPKKSSSTVMKPTPERTEYRAAPNGDIAGAPLTIAAAQAAAEQGRVRGVITYSHLYLGRTINIASALQGSVPGDYIVTGLRYEAGSGEGNPCTFEAVPKDIPPYPQTRPKPLIHSVHNAVVVGANDGEPACDAKGMVVVKFFWDTSSEKTNTSVPLRVAETYAGNGYGGQFIPRAGQEVLVSFLHGDPDAPVITGQIYNGKAKHPFMAAKTTKSGVTSKLKGKANELEFDDKAGSELLALRAAKDYALEVTEASKRDVKKTEDTAVGEAATLKTGKDYSVDVGANHKVKVKEKASVDADSLAVDVKNASEHDAKTIELSGSSKITLKVGSSKIEISSSSISISATNITVAAKSALKLEGLKVDAKAKTTMALKGLQVQVNGSVKTEVKGGAMAEVNGGGLLQLKGGVAMIN